MTGPGGSNTGEGWVAPGPAYGYQQPVWSPDAQPFTGGPGGPPKPNRKPLIIGLAVGAVVLVLLAVVGVVLLTKSSGGAGSPGEAVKGYLEALASGDADKALSYSDDQPASKDLLTDEILQQQIDKWPITDIKILSDDGSYGMGTVHVSVKFGDQTSDETIMVKKSGKRWKLEHAAIKLDNKLSINDEAEKTLTVFGKLLSESPAYVFPGWVDMGSENPNLDVELAKPLLLSDLGLSGEAYLNVNFSISDKGNKAITTAISSYLQKCTASTSLTPVGCPQRVYEYQLVDDSASWGTPDVSGLKIEASGFDLKARISGSIIFPLTARTRSGDTWSGSVTASVYGDADLTKDPPTVSLS